MEKLDVIPSSTPSVLPKMLGRGIPDSKDDKINNHAAYTSTASSDAATHISAVITRSTSDLVEKQPIFTPIQQQRNGPTTISDVDQENDDNDDDDNDEQDRKLEDMRMDLDRRWARYKEWLLPNRADN